MSQIACHACGYAAQLPETIRQLPDALQCPMCGTWIRNYAAEVQAASQPEPEAVADDREATIDSDLVGHLTLANTLTSETPYPVRGKRTVVGRDDADITIADPTMSIHHFEITTRGGEHFIRDLDTTNGTKVNGQKISATELRDGDRIQAGLTTLVFHKA